MGMVTPVALPTEGDTVGGLPCTLLGRALLCPSPAVARGLPDRLEGAALREARARLGIEGVGRKDQRHGT